MAFNLTENASTVQSVQADGASCAKTPTETKQDRPKPCCVCIDEKVARDECMLTSADGRAECAELIQNYKTCMKSFGFNV
ncbi:cysteine alpha-hairpin motif superfamily [Lipomyces tetrasporus]